MILNVPVPNEAKNGARYLAPLSIYLLRLGCFLLAEAKRGNGQNNQSQRNNTACYRENDCSRAGIGCNIVIKSNGYLSESVDLCRIEGRGNCLLPFDPTYPAIAVVTVCEAVTYWKTKRTWAWLLIAAAVICFACSVLELMW